MFVGFKYYVVFVICAAVSFLITPLIRKVSSLRGFLDKPNRRKVHRKSIPTLGGIAIYIAFLVGLSFIFNITGVISKSEIIGLLLGSSFIVLIGIYDDIKGIPALMKLLGQIIIASLLYYYGFRITEISGLFVEKIYLGYASYFITVFWIVAIINAINLLDGLDGLACGITTIVSIFLFIASLLDENFIVCLFALSLAGCCIGFLPYNFYPATIFMGDTGSMLLGLILSLLAVESYQKSTTFITLLVPIIVLAVPLIDTTLSVIRRFIRKRPLFKADREHIHHKMLKERSQVKTVLTLYLVTCFFGMIALGLRDIEGVYTFVALIIVGLVTFRWMKNLGFLEFEDNK